MREYPPDPKAIYIKHAENCAGCEDKPIHNGFQFPGSEALFCEECAAFLKAERRMAERRYQNQQARNYEIRLCQKCFKTYNARVRRKSIHCPRCLWEINNRGRLDRVA